MSNSSNSRHPEHPEHNKPGKEATQKNEAKRTPESRHDRESHVGSANQTKARMGGGSPNQGH